MLDFNDKKNRKMNCNIMLVRSVIVVLMFFIQGVTFAQVDKSFCKTNFKFNPNFSADIVETAFRTRSVDIIPIALHIITDSNGEGNEMTPELFLQALDSINQYLLTVNLKAELCLLNIVYDDDNVNPLIDFNGLLLDSLHESGHVNIFMPNTVSGTGAGGASTIVGGLFTNDDYLFILGQGATYGLIAHELGHFFGLYHTFETRFGAELVNGSNCDIAGDLLCDTDADHGLVRSDVDSTSCSWLYPNSVFDSNNEAFNPSITNFMSYSQLHCVNEFTPQQLQVMRNTYDLNVDYFENCQITSINNDDSQMNYNVKAYPNPSKNFIYLDLDKKHLNLELVLFDYLGKVMLKKSAVYDEEKLKLDIPDLPSGQYFLQVSNQDFIQIVKIFVA